MARNELDILHSKRHDKLDFFLKRHLDESVFNKIRMYEACIVVTGRRHKKTFDFVVLTDECIYLTQNPPKTIHEALHLSDVVAIELVRRLVFFNQLYQQTRRNQSTAYFSLVRQLYVFFKTYIISLQQQPRASISFKLLSLLSLRLFFPLSFIHLIVQALCLQFTSTRFYGLRNDIWGKLISETVKQRTSGGLYDPRALSWKLASV